MRLCGSLLTETCMSDIYVYFNVNFNVYFKLIKVHLLVSELYKDICVLMWKIRLGVYLKI